jgi:anti-sigma regulatory factor (Ser/Thr protein kinase)
VQFQAEPASAAKAREFVCDHLLRRGLLELEDDVRLVVSELVTNAITHAQTPFTVALERRGPSLILTVTDSLQSVPVLREAEMMDAGGRGLVIVAVLSGAWGVTTDAAGSKSVWAAFDIDDGVVVVS